MNIKSLLKGREGSSNIAPGQKLFNYVAVSNTGVRNKGRMQASNKNIVIESLQSENFIPILIEEVKSETSDITKMLTTKPVVLSTKQVATFARQLAELLKAGVPLPRALEALGSEGSGNLVKITSTLTELVTQGIPLSRALATFPKAFDEIFRSYVEAGEAAGTLALTMSRLATTLERRAETQNKIKAVTAYPKMVSSAIGMIVAGILIYLVPMFAEIYLSFNKPLPTPTKILQDITAKLPPFTFTSNMPMPALIEGKGSFMDLIISFIAVFIIFGLGVIKRRNSGKTLKKSKVYINILLALYLILFAYDYKINIFSTIFFLFLSIGSTYFTILSESGKINDNYMQKLDMIKFKMPIFGQLNFYVVLHRWTTVLAGALESGVTLDAGIDLAARTSGSKSHVLASKYIRSQLRNGLPLSEALNAYKEFYPANLRTMVKTGESAGELSTMVENISESLDSEIESIIAGLAAKIEVGLLVVMGVVVGGLLVVLYLPILKLSATSAEGIGG
jgi:type IV pilus assembly protein PilC